MDFARQQMEKYGWIEGKGLGKNEDGISVALKPKLKFDKSGIGHDPGEQFTNNWWERVFNTASNNINVQTNENEVQLTLNCKPTEISTKKYSNNNLNMEFGSFVKTERLTENGVENFNVKIPEKKIFQTLNDDELFAACGGRTAHKGARHGLKLSGKLSRIAKQEKILLKKMRNVSLNDKNTVEKKMKKIKKQKDDSNVVANNNVECDKTITNKKRNKKNSRKVSFNNETAVKYFTPESDHEKDENGNSLSPTSSSSSPTLISDEGIEQDLEEENNNEEIQDNHKSFEEAQNINDLSKAELKRLKKKRRMEKKCNATSKFLRQVIGDNKDFNDDDKNKKRKFVLDEDVMDVKLNEKMGKKKRYEKNKRKDRREINSIVYSLDFCRISDDE